MSFILSLDAGTTSVRAIIFDRKGGIRAVAQQEVNQFYPRPGWVEQNGEEIWSSAIFVAVEAMGRAGLQARDIAAVGIANQRETTLVWDRRTGKAIHPAIVWQDRRTAGKCDRLRADGHDPMVRKKTGLRLDAYFSATKIAWILDHVPGARKQAAAGHLAFGTVDTWLIWKLTGAKAIHVTDPSNASRTLLYHLHTRTWDDELLSLFRIPRRLLPEVRSSSEIYGHIHAWPGLEGVPIAGVAGDQQAALFGEMCVRPGLAKNTYGTGCFLLTHLGAKPVASRHQLLTTVAWQIGSRFEYALEGSVFMGGATVQWLRDGLKIVRSAEEASELAASVADSGGVFLVPAFTGLGAPHWDSYARGMMIGMTRDTTAAHLARAALEGIAFQVADLMEAMESDTGQPFKELRVDGGASRSEPLMQFQADLLGIPVVRPAITETTALGAAYLAGLAIGYWENIAAISTQWKGDRIFKPKMPRRKVEALRSRWREAVERAKGWESPESNPPAKSRRKS